MLPRMPLYLLHDKTEDLDTQNHTAATGLGLPASWILLIQISVSCSKARARHRKATHPRVYRPPALNGERRADFSAVAAASW